MLIKHNLEMSRVTLAEAYKVPDSYQPPDETNLIGNTQFPNLNSLEYRIKASDPSTKIHKFYETLDLNELGNIVIGTNDLRGRIWNCSFWAYESIEDVGNIEKISYKLQWSSNITNIKYIEPRIILVTDTNGGVHLWSTQAEVRSSNNYCLFNIGSKTEHISGVRAMELLNDDHTKAVTGSMDGCIKLWDMAAGDLTSIKTYLQAHSDCIYGISSKPKSDHIFASCSADKSLNIWDSRILTPVIDYNDYGRFAYTAIAWTSSLTSGQQYIYLGNEIGEIIVGDIRNLKELVTSFKLYDAPIHKIKFNGQFGTVLCHNNIVNVIDANKDYNIIYTNAESKDCVRDIYWKDSDTFYTVDWDSCLKVHKLDNK